MGPLRRIVVVGGKPHIQEIARQIAGQVFAADDLTEAADIVNTVTPEMAVFDETATPDDIRELLHKTDKAPGHPVAWIAAVSEESPFADRDYEDAGVAHCLRGIEAHRRLAEIARRMEEAPAPLASGAADETWFIDETAAAIGLVGRSDAIRKTLHLIQLVARSRCNPILITGETGTGKEIAAKGIHRIRHPDQPFVAVNCAALTATLLESELFGHVKGAFTGADRDKTGLLELAGQGTLFLDEISEMPLDLQAKLLRVLQEQSFRKVGGVKDLPCPATIIASSNRNLREEVQEKRFRQDLYYRLDVCPIVLAPLRSCERREDIRLLAEHFLRTSTIRGPEQAKPASITQLALEALCAHPWPGNVRELRNVMDRAVLLEATCKIGLDSIVIETMPAEETAGKPAHDRVRDFSLEKAERELIARALRETGWQKTQAASLLGITRATLYAKVKQYNIQRDLSLQSPLDATFSEPAQEQAVVVG
jgi:transcriptional regulator with PAS, ATPase and Fis domain